MTTLIIAVVFFFIALALFALAWSLARAGRYVEPVDKGRAFGGEYDEEAA